MCIVDLIKNVNKLDIGDSIFDPTSSWRYDGHRKFVNAFIKLGYLERTERDKVKKIKNIPHDLTFADALKNSKNIKLPLNQKYSVWGKLIKEINNHVNDEMLISQSMVLDVWCLPSLDSVRKYIGYLEKLEYINFKKRGYDLYNREWVRIIRLKHIPDNLTVSLAKKLLYDKMYRRKIKIEKIREKMNNI